MSPSLALYRKYTDRPTSLDTNSISLGDIPSREDIRSVLFGVWSNVHRLIPNSLCHARRRKSAKERERRGSHNMSVSTKKQAGIPHNTKSSMSNSNDFPQIQSGYQPYSNLPLIRPPLVKHNSRNFQRSTSFFSNVLVIVSIFSNRNKSFGWSGRVVPPPFDEELEMDEAEEGTARRLPILTIFALMVKEWLGYCTAIQWVFPEK